MRTIYRTKVFLQPGFKATVFTSAAEVTAKRSQTFHGQGNIETICVMTSDDVSHYNTKFRPFLNQTLCEHSGGFSISSVPLSTSTVFVLKDDVSNQDCPGLRQVEMNKMKYISLTYMYSSLSRVVGKVTKGSPKRKLCWC